MLSLKILQNQTGSWTRSDPDFRPHILNMSLLFHQKKYKDRLVFIFLSHHDPFDIFQENTLSSKGFLSWLLLPGWAGEMIFLQEGPVSITWFPRGPGHVLRQTGNFPMPTVINGSGIHTGKLLVSFSFGSIHQQKPELFELACVICNFQMFCRRGETCCSFWA